MIKHIKGNIFEQNADVICHQVNCQGVMASGVAKQVREKYPWVYATYKRACDKAKKSKMRMLGRCQEVFIDENKNFVDIIHQKCYT